MINVGKEGNDKYYREHGGEMTVNIQTAEETLTAVVERTPWSKKSCYTEAGELRIWTVGKAPLHRNVDLLIKCSSL